MKLPHAFSVFTLSGRSPLAAESLLKNSGGSVCGATETLYWFSSSSSFFPPSVIRMICPSPSVVPWPNPTVDT